VPTITPVTITPVTSHRQTSDNQMTSMLYPITRQRV
jgi:hypothetical protein